MSEDYIAGVVEDDPDDIEPVCPRRFGRLCVDVASPALSIDHVANRVALIWPDDDSDRTVVTRDVLIGIVDRINRDAAGLDRLRRLLAEALTSWEGLARLLCAEHCDPGGEGHDGDTCGADLDTIARIRREAGLT